MSSVIHIVEVAALLTAAYVLGWLIGYAARRIASRPKAAQPAIPPERIAAVTGADPDALVKAPVVVPVASDPPAAADAMPAPADSAAPPAPAAMPAHPQPAIAEAQPTTSPLSSIVIPAVAAPPPLFPVTPEPAAPAAEIVSEPAAAEGHSLPATVVAAAPAVEPAEQMDPAPAASEPVPVSAPEPGPVPALEDVPTPQVVTAAPPPPPQPAAVFTATPAARPGEAWSGEVNGRAPAPFKREVGTVLPAVEREAAIELDPAPTVVEPPLEPPSTPVAVAPSSPPAPRREYDEDEAMRAIEGGWSRVKARAMPDAPELHDLGAAVAAAQTAVEQVLAKAGIDPVDKFHTGKPKGLIRARTSGKDDLKQINGLGALDESTLNNLGFFHFDQIASWNEHEVLWMESHVFARGRIGREEWQSQARALAAKVDG